MPLQLIMENVKDLTSFLRRQAVIQRQFYITNLCKITRFGVLLILYLLSSFAMLFNVDQSRTKLFSLTRFDSYSLVYIVYSLNSFCFLSGSVKASGWSYWRGSLIHLTKIILYAQINFLIFLSTLSQAGPIFFASSKWFSRCNCAILL